MFGLGCTTRGATILGMKDEEWEEPEPPQPADPNRGMRRLAQAVLAQAVADFKSLDQYLRHHAEQFLYPSAERLEDLRWTIEVSALGSEWMNQNLTRLRRQTPPIPTFRTCVLCRQPHPIESFHGSGNHRGSLSARCKFCTRDHAIKRKAARAGRAIEHVPAYSASDAGSPLQV